jgi:hypothetical protein
VESDESPDSDVEYLCTLKVVNGEGQILAVAAPSPDQLHQQAAPGRVGPQAMIYQALFSGRAGEDSTIVHAQATVLIDTGATQNFAGDRYVQRHDLHSFPAVPIAVALADGKRLVADRTVAMMLQFGTHKYVQNVYVLPLGVPADIILGMPWLHSLDEFTCNMHNHELSFVHNVGHGRHGRIVLRAQPDAPSLASTLQGAEIWPGNTSDSLGAAPPKNAGRTHRGAMQCSTQSSATRKLQPVRVRPRRRAARPQPLQGQQTMGVPLLPSALPRRRGQKGGGRAAAGSVPTASATRGSAKRHY